MVKKKIEVTEEGVEEPVEVKTFIPSLEVNFGREDLNLLASKINEIINAINLQRV
jgi:hypothetical protein